MNVTRRGFMKAAGVSGIGAIAIPLIGARGSEALRDGILDLAPWRDMAFDADERTAWRRAIANAVRLDSNENPNGPGQTALDAIRGMFGEASRYPDSPTEDLRHVIASRRQVAAENVLVGCGSTENLRMAVLAFTSPQRALVTAAPSFEDPGRFTELTQAAVKAVPVDGRLALDLDRMLDASADAGLIYLCNPNNPTATVHGASAVRDFIASVNRRAPDAVILVDEAYHEYVDEPTYATAIPLALQNPNVVVIRTFSKVYGMAGLRLGYAVARPETIARMQRHKLPSNVNALAAAAGIATIADDAHIAREQQLNRDAREFTRRAFEQMGYKSPVSNANFIMVPIGRDSKVFKEACAKQGILVGRAFPPLTTHARISIGTMDEMKRAVDVFRQVLSGAAD
ncbi:MAG TPA: aminotransferase class I/II-fold pyridoxal phosphate-dependent enzyme [Gemmatimonadaceae bacterium]|nr:aminotransferase class I/II-fold pyridoxal phosphate-dependent enzyme [Gemmatimonadaceae bacterium]